MFGTYLCMAEVPSRVMLGCYSRQRKKREGERERERHYTNDLWVSCAVVLISVRCSSSIRGPCVVPLLRHSADACIVVGAILNQRSICPALEMFVYCLFLLVFLLSKTFEVHQKYIQGWNKPFPPTLVQIVNGKFMLSSVEEAKEGENFGDLYVDRRIILNTQRDSKRWTQFRTSVFPELYMVCEWST
jgi:hypothetical protein